MFPRLPTDGFPGRRSLLTILPLCSLTFPVLQRLFRGSFLPFPPINSCSGASLRHFSSLGSSDASQGPLLYLGLACTPHGVLGMAFSHYRGVYLDTHFPNPNFWRGTSHPNRCQAPPRQPLHVGGFGHLFQFNSTAYTPGASLLLPCILFNSAINALHCLADP